jgi:exodeoxyribonuclease VII small subunit
MADREAGRGDAMSFEASLERLQQIVKELEEGQGGLESSIRLYEEGRGLVRECTARLDEAQERIERLVRSDEGMETRQIDGSQAWTRDGTADAEDRSDT